MSFHLQTQLIFFLFALILDGFHTPLPFPFSPEFRIAFSPPPFFHGNSSTVKSETHFLMFSCIFLSTFRFLVNKDKSKQRIIGGAIRLGLAPCSMRRRRGRGSLSHRLVSFSKDPVGHIFIGNRLVFFLFRRAVHLCTTHTARAQKILGPEHTAQAPKRDAVIS